MDPVEDSDDKVLRVYHIFCDNHGAKAYYPIPHILPCIKDFCRESSNGPKTLDFTGCEQLTDEFLFALQKFSKKNGPWLSIKTLDFTGCVYISDLGLSHLSCFLTDLKEVIFDGCPLVTEVGLSRFLEVFTSVEHVSARASGISHIPSGVLAGRSIRLEGCPLINPYPVPLGTELSVLPNEVQLVMMSSSGSLDLPCLADYLITGSLNVKAKTPLMHYRPNAMIPGCPNVTFNIVECEKHTNMLAPFTSSRSIFVYYIDLETADNIQLFVMAQVNMIKAIVPNATVLILLGHESTSPQHALRVEQLGHEVRNYLTSQNKHIAIQLDENQDFKLNFEQQQSKSIGRAAAKNNVHFEVFRLITDSGQVIKHWPKVRDFTKEKEDLMAQYEALLAGFEPVWENVVQQVSSISKRDISEVKSFSSIPPALKDILYCMGVFMAQNDPHNYKRMLSDLRILGKMQDLSQFEQNVSMMQCKKVGKILIKPHVALDQLRKYSSFAYVVRIWCDAVFKYVTEVQPEVQILKAKLRTLEKEMQEESHSVSKDVKTELTKVSDRLQKAEDAFQQMWKTEVVAPLNTVTQSMIGELKNLTNPPNLVKEVTTAVAKMMDCDDPTNPRSFFKNKNVIQEMIDINLEFLKEEKLHIVEDMMKTTDFSDTVRKQSKVAAKFAKWLEGIWKYHKEHKPGILDLREKKAQLKMVWDEQLSNLDNGADAASTMEQIQEEIIAMESSWNVFFQKPLTVALNPTIQTDFKKLSELSQSKNCDHDVRHTLSLVAALLGLKSEESEEISVMVETDAVEPSETNGQKPNPIPTDQNGKHELQHSKMLLDPDFYKTLLNFDKDSVTPEMIKSLNLEKYADYISTEKAGNVQSGLFVLKLWLTMIYRYKTKHKPGLESLKNQLLRLQQGRQNTEGNSCNSSQIVESLNAAVQRLCLSHALETDSKMSAQAIKVVAMVEAFKDRKILTSSELWTQLGDVEHWFNFQSLEKLLIKLHLMGRILYYPKMRNKPLVTDVLWFAEVCNRILHLDNVPGMQSNGSHAMAFHAGAFILDLSLCLNTIASEDQLLMLEGILLEQGVLLRTPCSPAFQPTSKWALFVYPLIPNDTYLRTSPHNGRVSSFQLKELLWPGSSERNPETEVHLRLEMSAGRHPIFLPVLFNELLKMSTMFCVSRYGCYVRQGLVEIQINNDIHGTLVSNVLEVRARTCKYHQNDQDVIRDYIWSVLSRYLIVIKNFIKKFHMFSEPKMVCPGNCSFKGIANTFSDEDVHFSKGKKLLCKSCVSSDNDVPRNGLLQGYTVELPFHDYNEVFIPEMKVLSQALYPWPDPSDPSTLAVNQWMCSHCGIKPVVANKLWKFQRNVHPGFICEDIHVANGTNEANTILRGNCLSSNGGRVGVWLPHCLGDCSLVKLEVTLLRDCPVWIVIGETAFFSSGFVSDEDTIPSKMVPHHLSLQTAKYVQAFADGTVTEHDLETCFKTGDKITLTIGEMKYQENQKYESSFLVDIDVYHNGNHIHKLLDIASDLHLGLVLDSAQAMGENPDMPPANTEQPCVALRCHAYRHIMNYHIPVGSVLLYRMVNNQWTVARVQSYFENQLELVIDKLGKGKEIVQVSPASDGILPLEAFQDITVVVNNDILKKSDLDKYCTDHCAYPLPSQFFQSFQGKRKNQCTTHLTPQVLELEMLHIVSDPLTSSNTHPYVLLPAAMESVNLMNPCQQAMCNLTKQAVHFVCMSQKAGLKHSHGHFVDVPPQKVDEASVQSILCVDNASLYKTYQALCNSEHMYPEPVKLSHVVCEEGFTTYEAQTQLLKMFDLYMSYLCLSLYLDENPAPTVTASDEWAHVAKRFVNPRKDAMLSVKNSKEKITEMFNQACSAKQETLQLDEANDLPYCPAHSRTTQNALRLYPSEVTEAQLGGMASCVEAFSVSNVNQDVGQIISLLPSLLEVSVMFCPSEFMESLKSCNGLRHINVSINGALTIPDFLPNFSQTLTSLRMAGAMHSVPDSICELVHLQTLVLPGAVVSSLPENIGNLTHLRALHVVFSGRRLPASFASLKNLKVLHLSGPAWLISDVSETSLTKEQEQLLKANGLPSLQWHLYENTPRLGQNEENASTGGVPPEIFGCYHLETLLLSNHAFKFIPGDISKLRNLRRVLFNNCPDLETISEAIGSAKNLEDLDLKGCKKLRTPPQEIIAQGRSTLLGYIQRLSQGSVKCFQTKLMFVGLGGAGKTTLMRALMNTESNQTTSLEGEAITDGIDISKWHAKIGNLNITYSVWDFAGQTVYYNTHQFFLSNRAVYLLIWNTRLGYEHSGLEFWLSSIACHCPGAPVFIVGTHADQIALTEIPKDKLCKRFSNIFGFHKVSALDGRGISKLRTDLLQVTSEQPYMGEQIPEAWRKFETEILSHRDKASLVAIAEVEQMANHCGISGDETLQAIRFLTSLGSLFHNEGDLLKDQVVINPQWIIDIMACLVSVHNKYVIDGHLKHSDIANIWKDYPPELHGWMLSLTEAFDLTFPLPEGGESIVPCLLPQKEPKYMLPEVEEGTRQTKMIYHFEYLPTGLFNRAQVRLYEYSDSSSLWKQGSLLKKRGQTALMKQISPSEVLVHAVGPQPENMVLLVHESFESLIADFFKGVKYEYYLPCTECIRNDVPEPSMFSSEVMRRALERKALFIQCHNDFHIQSMTVVQSNLLPRSSMDYDLQLQNTMRALHSMEETLERDVFILYSSQNIPPEGSTGALHPQTLNDDLIKHGLKSCFVKDLESCHIEDIAIELKSAKVVLLLISSEFVASDVCQRMYEFACQQLQKDMVLGMVGSGRDWQQSDLGMQLIHKLFVNLQRMNLYPDKLQELIAQIRSKISARNPSKQRGGVLAEPEVFLSYCWTNSASAVEAGHTRHKDGAISTGDPRHFKNLLEQRGIITWMDIERTGRMGLYEDISEGMRQCKVVVACVSDEYVQSPNCQMEFRFAHIALQKPIVLAVVGTGFLWESTEIGMLSLGYPKLNMQLSSPLSHDTFVNTIEELLQTAQPSTVPIRPITPLSTTKEMEFQELFELAQRKFLRQIMSYGEGREPFPRLFVADLHRPQAKSQHLIIKDGESVDEPEKLEEEKKFTLSNLTPGQFCIKMLCESEKGWHVADAGLPVDMGGAELMELWQRASPYMARILAILKHSNTNLDILHMPEGKQLLEMLTQMLTQSVQSNVQSVYTILREYLLRKDKEGRRGDLFRCHLPSGKILWLCEKHSKLPRVTVLEHKVLPHFADELKPETFLLNKLRNLDSKNAGSECVPDVESQSLVLPSSSRGPSRPGTARSRPPSAGARPGSAMQPTKDTTEEEKISKRSTVRHVGKSKIPVDSGDSQDRSSPRSGATAGRYKQLLRRSVKDIKKGGSERGLVMPADVMAHVVKNGATATSQACTIV